MANDRRFPYHCSRARKDLAAVFARLKATELLGRDWNPDEIDRLVIDCGPCRTKKRKPSKCTGWRLVVPPTAPLLFTGATLANATVRPELTADLSFERAAPAVKDSWEKHPMASGVVTIEFFEVKTDELLERFHTDLAGSHQVGPVWHLQRGGNPASGTVPSPWIQEARFPILPFDLTLVVEMIAYMCFNDVWRTKLQTDGEWKNVVKRSENLLLSHWRELFTAHFGTGSRTGTWLEMVDNGTDQLAPRPA